MKDTAAQCVGLILFAILSLCMATAPELAFWGFFAALGVAAPVVVIIESIRLIRRQRKGGHRDGAQISSSK